MVIDKSMYARRKPKKLNYDYRSCIRFNKQEADEFKEYYGRKWHDKIRELMREQLAKDKEIERLELIKRKKYLNNSYVVKSQNEL